MDPSTLFDPYLLFYIPVFIGLGLALLAVLSANGRDE